MKVKELKNKYSDYTIELYGRPLKNEMIPYSYLPFGNLDNYEVKDVEIIEKEHLLYTYNFNNVRKINKVKGYVRAYIRKEV